MSTSTIVLLLAILAWLYTVVSAFRCYFNDKRPLDSTLVFMAIATFFLCWMYVMIKGLGR